MIHTCRLQYLNLDENQLASIPRLRLLGTSSLRLSSHHSSSSGEAVRSTSTRGGGGEGLAPSPFPALHTLSLMNNMV